MKGIEKIDVIDVNKLNLPRPTYEFLACHYEVNDGGYYRYYPDDSWKYIPKQHKDIVNKALSDLGFKFPEEMSREVGHPDGYFQFYVLLYFNW